MVCVKHETQCLQPLSVRRMVGIVSLILILPSPISHLSISVLTYS